MYLKIHVLYLKALHGRKRIWVTYYINSNTDQALEGKEAAIC